ncbi:hypothetical protein Barb7_01806 [Bacteroidales bacterium Barb7]|nr:hypothetical protein Barb7_01806 [Bacteroidales bacterium Barb7]
MNVRTQFFGQGVADVIFQFGIVDVFELHALRHVLLAGSVEVKFFLIYIIDTLEALPHVNRPAQGAHLDMQFLFHLIQEVERVFPVTIHLVDKHDDGRFPHTANFHQFAGLRFHPFGGINDDDDTVHRRQRAEGILGKVLMTGRIQDINLMVGIIKSHDRSCHRYAALLLYLHPVGRSRFPYLVRLHRSGNMDGSAEQ